VAGSDEAVRWNWGLAAELNVPVVLHCRASPGVWPVSRLCELGVLRPGAVFIHGTGLDATELRMIADHECALSVAPAVEMIMGHGYPPVLDAIDAGLWPSLSVDVETATGADLFTQMRAAQQVARHARQHQRSSGPLVSARQILECATVHGAQALGIGGSDWVAASGQAGRPHPAAHRPAGCRAGLGSRRRSRVSDGSRRRRHRAGRRARPQA
jgi:cytosine/adenosine deaminase-related metal-dependent hydrolase